MILSIRQQMILTGILEDRDHLAAMTPRYGHGNLALARERDDIENAKQGLIRSDPARWFGITMTNSEWVMTSRNYSQLEAKGLIQRHALSAFSEKMTHLSLTEAGEAEARRLLAAGESV